MALNNEWPKEREALLRKLWLLGWPQSRIAKEIGVGKNAITGKARRMGLPKRSHKSNAKTYEAQGTEHVYRPGDPSPYSRRFIEKREANG